MQTAVARIRFDQDDKNAENKIGVLEVELSEYPFRYKIEKETEREYQIIVQPVNSRFANWENIQAIIGQAGEITDFLIENKERMKRGELKERVEIEKDYKRLFEGLCRDYDRCEETFIYNGQICMPLDEEGEEIVTFDTYKEACMSFQEDERRNLEDPGCQLLDKSDYELMGLMPEYTECLKQKLDKSKMKKEDVFSTISEIFGNNKELLGEPLKIGGVEYVKIENTDIKTSNPTIIYERRDKKSEIGYFVELNNNNDVTRVYLRETKMQKLDKKINYVNEQRELKRLAKESEDGLIDM